MSNDETANENHWFSRFGWAVVLGAVLSMSAYSLFYVGRNLGMPWYFAAIVSTCFDGVAILSADYSLRYARLGLTSTGPQITVYVFAGLSAYLNTLHTYFGHEIATAKILWAAPPIAAVITFEFHNRWARLSALRAANRIPDALPSLGKYSWIRHPIESHKAMQIISGERLGEVIKREAPSYVATEQAKAIARESESERIRLDERAREVSEAAKLEREAEIETARSQADAIRKAFDHLGEGAKTQDVIAYLAEREINVASARVRQVRASVNGYSLMREIMVSGPCAYCGANAETVDHIVPRFLGGDDEPENLVPACVTCNSSKGAKTLAEWDPRKVQNAIANSPKVRAVWDLYESMRLAEESQQSAESHEREVANELSSAPSMAARVRVALRENPGASAPACVSWLANRGITNVPGSYVRQIRALDSSREAQENRKGIRAISSPPPVRETG